MICMDFLDVIQQNRVHADIVTADFRIALAQHYSSVEFVGLEPAFAQFSKSVGIDHDLVDLAYLEQRVQDPSEQWLTRDGLKIFARYSITVGFHRKQGHDLISVFH